MKPLKNKRKKTEVKPEVKLTTFEVQVYPKPFTTRVLAADVESAIKEGVSKFKEKFPNTTMSGVNVQQK